MQPLVNSGSSASDELVNEVDRRAHHNALERRRRHHIKDSFATLRAMLPTSMEPRASRASILNATASYIMTLNTIIAALKSENEKTEGHIRHIEVLCKSICCFVFSSSLSVVVVAFQFNRLKRVYPTPWSLC
ncbi:hypothetical protein M514_00443 [Trichuris suis]|uniref:BHLH domain-containing protein n=1 Tax=Trichuris suis TaxID=68888 RepID=A0A085NRD4_9BILA|nr:hypothetical protein M514_00443 [Trichuris suis]